MYNKCSILQFNLNFNILKQINCVLVGLKKRLENIKMHGTTVKEMVNT